MNLLAALLAAYLDFEPGATEVASDYLAESGEPPLSGDASQVRRLEEVISRLLSPEEAHRLTVQIAQQGLTFLADNSEIIVRCVTALEQSAAAPNQAAARSVLATYRFAQETTLRRVIFSTIVTETLNPVEQAGLSILSIWAACSGCHAFARQVARETSPDAISWQIDCLKAWLNH